jgi:hypothetical protein
MRSPLAWRALGTALLLTVTPVLASAQADVPAPAVDSTAPLSLLAPDAPQADTPLTRADAFTAPVLGPLATPGVALRVRTEAPAPALLPDAPQDTRRGNAALMIVGLATMVVGAVVGDDAGTIIVLTGAGIGLYGLYRYMR